VAFGACLWRARCAADGEGVLLRRKTSLFLPQFPFLAAHGASLQMHRNMSKGGKGGSAYRSPANGQKNDAPLWGEHRLLSWFS
jgi:hypothetical protein